MRPSWQLLRRAWRKLRSDRVPANSASVAFFLTLASFPGIAAVVAFAQAIADPERIRTVLGALSNFFPDHVIRIFESQIRLALAQTAAAGDQPLSSAIVLFTVLIWSANRGTRVMIDALNTVYGRKETRRFLRFTAVSLAMTAGFAIFAVLAVALILVLPHILNAIGIGGQFRTMLTLLRWPILLATGAVAIGVLYRFGPSPGTSKPRWIGLGSVAASVLLVAFSVLLSWYLGVFGSFTELYGSLRAIVGFMLWLWLSVLAVLIGAELDDWKGDPAPAGSASAGPA